MDREGEGCFGVLGVIVRIPCTQGFMNKNIK